MTNLMDRFLVSFLGNAVRGLVAFGTAMLLARWLGPVDYGRMTFLLASFVAMRGILDFGSSATFFTLISQRKRSRRFVSTFWIFVLIQIVVVLVFLLMLLPGSIIATIWVGEARHILALAFLAAFMQGTVWSLAAQMAEANRQTMRAQKINTVVVVMHALVMLLLVILGKLIIPLVFLALIIEWAIAAWFAYRLYFFDSMPSEKEIVAFDTPKSVLQEFLPHCIPLFPTMVFGFVHDFGDRWMLQAWGGDTQQAYFGIAQQYSVIALLATASVLRIFWKEIAEAHYLSDLLRIEALYKRATHVLFFIGAFLAGWLLPIISEVLYLTVGQAYVNGVMTVAIMLFYPVHQSIGQITGTLLLATGKSNLYAWMSLSSMFMGLLVAYFLLAPRGGFFPGLQMGAEGLAIKLVLVQVISVNLMMLVIARIFGWRFDWLFQVVALMGCIGLGTFAHFIIWQLSGQVLGFYLKFLLMSALYLCLIGLFVYIFPWIISGTRGDLKYLFVRCRSIVLRG